MDYYLLLPLPLLLRLLLLRPCSELLWQVTASRCTCGSSRVAPLLLINNW